MVAVLLGPPGVGKGTQAARLADHIAAEHVSTGDLLRAARRDGTTLGKEAQDFMDAGEYVPDDLILAMVREHFSGMSADAHVLLDGFPRTTAQATGLDISLESIERQVDVVVVFEAPQETLLRRLSGRRNCSDCGAVYNTYSSPPAADSVCDRCNGALVHRADDEPDTVKRRLEVYQEQTAPLVSFYERHGARLERVVADRPADDVYRDFASVVGVTK